MREICRQEFRRKFKDHLISCSSRLLILIEMSFHNVQQIFEQRAWNCFTDIGGNLICVQRNIHNMY